jgi:two-component system NtrC family sensor kinase
LPDVVLIAGFAVRELFPQLSGVVLLLGITALLYRAFRERYLLGWALGWCTYLLFRFAAVNAADHTVWHAVQDVSYALTAALFAVSVLHYAGRARQALPAAVLAAIGINFALIHALLRPQSEWLTWAAYVCSVALCCWAAMRLAVFASGRGSLSPWPLVLVLLLWPLESPDTPWRITAPRVLFEVGLGAAMLLVILDDLYRRLRRLQVVDSVAEILAGASEFAPMVSVVLPQLRNVIGSDAAWFRLLDGKRLLLIAQEGLSQQYLQSRAVLSAENTFTGDCIRQRRARVLRARQADNDALDRLRADRFEHVLVLPVEGRNGPVGALSFAGRRRRDYTADEKKFLATIARHLGIAIENLRLLEQVLYAQRQWVNTFDSIADALVVHDEAGRIIRGNRKLAKRLQLEPTHLQGRTLGELLGRAIEPCPYCVLAKGEKVEEGPDPCFGGTSSVATYSYSEDGSRQLGTVHIVRDTTEQRMAVERYKLLFEGVQEGAFISTPDGQLLDCNPAFVRMLGYETREQLLHIDIAQAIWHEPERRAEFRRQMEQNGYVQGYEVTLRRKDGSVLVALESSFATRDTSGAVERYQGFLLDITEKKRAELELRRRNEQLGVLNGLALVASRAADLQQILEHTLQRVIDLYKSDSGSIYLLEEDGQTLRRRAVRGHHFPAHGAEFNLSPEFMDAITAQHVQLITSEQIAHLPAAALEVIRTEGIRSFTWGVLWTQQKPIGIIGIGCRTSRTLTSDENSLLAGIAGQLAGTVERQRLYEQTARAYEDLRHTQEQLLQSEKMSAVGQLISGVAHELNNPLTAILGYTELLATEVESDRGHDFVQKITRQAHRTHRVVQNLLSFARQRKPQKEQVDLRTAVEDTLQLRDYDLRLNNIEIERDFSEVPPVIADSHQLEQVFLNIVNNAADAMLEKSKGGTLGVRVYAQTGTVYVEFRDSGPGVTDTKRIFDPFYTTKQVGKGTGLGLSICYGIIKEHGGEISARNHAQGGAVFSISLPVAKSAEDAARTVTTPKRAESLMSGRVLLVDDEESVLEFEREVLTSAGAEVTCLNNGDAAIERLKAESFDAIVLDGKMPGGWNGIDIYRWVVEHVPQQASQVVLTLSDVDEIGTRELLQQKKVPYLVKPFEVAELIAAIRRLTQQSQAKATGR